MLRPHFLIVPAALLFIAAPAEAQRLCVTGMRILNAAPIQINCGGALRINCEVDYIVDNINFNWGNCWVCDIDEKPKKLTGQLWDDDGWLGDELYGQTTVTIPRTPIGGGGTIPFSIDVTCTFDEDCEDCEINGDENEAELFVAFWNELIGPGSVIKIGRCVCNTSVNCMQIRDFEGVLGEPTPVMVAVRETIENVSHYDVTIVMDPATFQLGEMFFHDPLIQANTTVLPLPNGVRFMANFDPPIDLPQGPFADMVLLAAPGGQPGLSQVRFDQEMTVFIDGAGEPIDACIAAGDAAMRPRDEEAPRIDPALILYTDCAIIGLPGAVQDNHLGLGNGYVTVEADYNGSPGPLQRVVREDGSFLFPIVTAPKAGPLRLRAFDAGGNETAHELVDPGPCPDCNANGVHDWVDVWVGFSEDRNGNMVPDECERGDMNCDGLLDNEDIDPFVLALVAPARYAAAWPNCNALNGDVNCDGLVDNEDIDGFVECIATGGCPLCP